METTPQAEHIHFLFDPHDVLAVFAVQRSRFATAVEGLSAQDLASPSRCAAWTVADVLRHLVWVDDKIRGIWAGDLTRAAGFDPRTTPNEAVQDAREIPDREIQERYLVSSETMISELAASDRQRYGDPALSPAGQVPWWMSVLHVGWDSSIHERDALLPLGRTVESPDGETEICLAYSLVLTSFFAGGDPLSVRLGTTELTRDDGPVSARPIAVSDPPATGSHAQSVMETENQVECIDAMAGRGSVEEALSGDPDVVYRLGGMARFFTSPPR